MTGRNKNKKYSFCGSIRLFILVMVLVLNIRQRAHAQTFYYFVYEAAKAGETHIFKTLIMLQPDGTATARVQYNAGINNKLYLYDVYLADSSIETQGITRKYLIPRSNPVPLLDKDTNGFLKPRFIFKKNYDSAGYYYAASGSETEISDGKWSPAKTTLSQQKTFEDLRDDEPFVSSFYFESDPFYRYIFGSRTRAIPISRTEKMFLIVVANTSDSSVGESAQLDLKNVSRLFKDLAQNLGIIKFFPLYVSGNGYSKSAVEASLAVIEKQQPSPKDIVVFYYSGHGFRLQGDKSIYPRMSYRTKKNKANKEIGDNIGLEDVYNRIKAMKPGVTLVLGDCCNADIFEKPVLGNDVIKPKGGGVLGDFNLESGNKLFFPPAPVAIIIGSVKQGHRSWGHPEIGGYYTHFFTTELEKNLWGYSSFQFSESGKTKASWLRMLINARENTYWRSKQKQCGKTENDRCIQEAEIDVNPPQ